MRGVGDEVLLDAQQPLHPLCHLVEGAGQRALLGAALDRDAGVEVAAGDLTGGAVEAADRAGDLLRDQRAGNDAKRQHHGGDRGDVEDRGAHGAVDGVDALGDPDRAAGAAVLEHRHRGGEDFGAEGFAVAGDLLAVAAQRRPHLGPVGVAAAWLGPGRVGDQAATAVDDDDAAADAVGRDSNQPPQPPRLDRAEQLRGGDGDDVGLAAGLAADLGVDAVAQAQRQRHAKRDQRQRQHVGQRQQQGGPEAYGSSARGAAKRKPTPRTVSM